MKELDEVGGLGSDRAVSADDLALLKAAADEIRADYADQVLAARRSNEDTRYARWTGQSPDGRKRRDALGKEPKPFEGASDSRQRTADQVIQERVRLIVAATQRVMPSAAAMEEGDSGRAARVSTYLEWLIRNRWGSQYRRTIELLANYREGDTPAVAVAFVDWHEDECLQYREISRVEVVEQLVKQLAAPDEAAIFGINDLLTNPLRVEDLAETLAGVLGVELKPAQLRRLAGEIIETGTGRYPAPYVRASEPRIVPLRVYEDVFYRHNVTDLNLAPLIIRRRWLTKAQGLAEAARDGWSDAFTEALFGKEGEAGQEAKSAFDEDWDDSKNPQLTDNLDPHKGLYEVLTSYRQAVNEDGVMGIFVETWSAFVDVAAKDRELWDRKHGKYPFVAFPRECLTSRLNDSRGWSDLLATQQTSLKMLSDSFEDHVQVTINPPIKKPRGRPFFEITLAPFGQIDEDRADSIKFMDRPPYPQSADKFWREKRREVNEYAGRFDPDTNPNQTATDLAQQDCVDSFLAPLADCFQLVVQLAQQFETDERLARITGGMDEPMPRSLEEIQGEFDIRIYTDVRDLDLEKVIKKTKLVMENLVPLDRSGLLPYNDVIRDAVAALNPNWARKMPTVEAAMARVQEEERQAFTQILSGVEPPMPERIDAPGARLEMLKGMMQPRMVNPQAFPQLSQAAVELYNQRVQYLTFQDQQNENAQTGRTGVEPVDLAAVGQPEEAVT